MTRVIITTVGGAIYGSLMYVFPLTLGDGSVQLGTVLKYPSEIGNDVLAASVFAKLLSYWICAECGFVGGIFFPCLLTSVMLGG
jgi:H+/Cl- antiporter ClcA